MKKLLLFCCLLSLCTSYLFAQTSTIKPDKACINCPTDEPASSAVFEIQSTDKGILLPRMTTTERTNINSPADALLVYDTDTQSFWYYNASQWQELGASLSNQNLAQVLAEGNDANALKIVNLSDPSNLQDAATKAYVDANDEVDDADANPNNELQDLSLSGNTLSLTDDATTVDLSGFENNWTTYGEAPIIFGFNNTVAGDSSSAVGYTNRAVGLRSSAFGHANDATGDRSSAFGYSNDATGASSSAFGYINEATGDQSNALGYLNDATGASSSALGYVNEATERNSSALGSFNDATGEQSSAFGYANEATGFRGSAFGHTNDATGDRSSALGYFNDATGDQSSAFGYRTVSNIYGLMAVGRWNATPVGSATTWGDTDPVFVIGNGEDASSRSTALTILKNGKVGIGTDHPQAKLEVDGTLISDTLSINGNELADNTRINFRASDNSNRFQIETDLDGSTLNDLLGFRAAQTDNILVLKGNGNIGVNTTDPQAKIQIVGGEDADEVDGGSLILGSLSGNNIGMDDNEIQARNNGMASDLYLQAGDGTGAGNVGIGTFSATARLDINGTARIRDLPTGGTNSVLVDANGNLFKSSSSPNFNEQRINDQQEEIEDLQKENELLKAENEAIKARLAKIEALLSGKVEHISTTTSTLTSATLSQNAPNPFDEVTKIDYFIPENVKSASLQVLDQHGRIIKRIPIQATGNGQITLQANLLSAGTYSYSLILDGQVMETKQMVLTH